jgi:hypothetical protein
MALPCIYFAIKRSLLHVFLYPVKGHEFFKNTQMKPRRNQERNMKNILLIAAALFITVAANAQRGPRGGSCTINLEREAYRGSGYRFVQSFTEFGRFACEDAQQRCRNAKFDRAFSYEYRCEKDFSTRPVVKTCEYRIETRRGFTSDRFSVSGVRPCQTAKQRCEDELSYQRRWGMVGLRATCVQTSGTSRPTPRPTPTPRLVSASCSVDLLAGRVGRRTGNVYTSTQSARNYTEARQRACNNALAQCDRVKRGTMRCEIRR